MHKASHVPIIYTLSLARRFATTALLQISDIRFYVQRFFFVAIVVDLSVHVPMSPVPNRKWTLTTAKHQCAPEGKKQQQHQRQRQQQQQNISKNNKNNNNKKVTSNLSVIHHFIGRHISKCFAGATLNVIARAGNMGRFLLTVTVGRKTWFFAIKSR